MMDHEIKGYCPGALKPMRSGDGLVVRVRPFAGRITSAQAAGIAALAATHGNGSIDLSIRGNLQIRGVSEAGYHAVLDGLAALDLLDADAVAESRRNVLVTPFWRASDETEVIGQTLSEALRAAHDLELPSKFGFVVDTGHAPVLQDASGDIRIERQEGGELLLVADGCDTGLPVTMKTVVDEALALARWFVARSNGVKRMAQLFASGEVPPVGYDIRRKVQNFAPTPGYTPQGALAGLSFGQLSAATLAALAEHGDLRMTPWRMLLIEGAREVPQIDGLISASDDPLLRVVACAGTDGCAQARADTRALARSLAETSPLDETLHVSGCSKGCAHPKAAAVTITATANGYDLVRNGRAGDAPLHKGLDPETLTEII